MQSNGNNWFAFQFYFNLSSFGQWKICFSFSGSVFGWWKTKFFQTEKFLKECKNQVSAILDMNQINLNNNIPYEKFK